MSVSAGDVRAPSPDSWPDRSLRLIALLFALSLTACEPITQAAPPAPTVIVEHATVHYWGDRGRVRLRVKHLARSARLRAYHPLCTRTLFDVPISTDTLVTLDWTAAKCPPSPYGYEMVQSVLAAYGGDILATNAYRVRARYGGP